MSKVIGVKLAEIARANAAMAIDLYRSKGCVNARGHDTAIAAHAVNVVDTMTELGYAATDDRVTIVLSVYYSQVAAGLL